MEDWIRKLSPGDKVIVNYQIGNKIGTVKRVTKTMIVTENHGRFRKKNGVSCGDCNSFFRQSIEEATPNEINKIKICEDYNRKYKDIMDVIDKLKHKKVSYHSLHQIHSLLIKLKLIEENKE